jgi:ribosomal protein S13
MKVYDCAGLQQLLGIGRDRAYSILRSHGFRCGDRALRISEPQIIRYTEERSNDKQDKSES